MTSLRKHRDRLRTAPVCKEAYQKPKRNPKSAPNAPRPPIAVQGGPNSGHAAE